MADFVPLRSASSNFLHFIHLSLIPIRISLEHIYSDIRKKTQYILKCFVEFISDSHVDLLLEFLFLFLSRPRAPCIFLVYSFKNKFHFTKIRRMLRNISIKKRKKKKILNIFERLIHILSDRCRTRFVGERMVTRDQLGVCHGRFGTDQRQERLFLLSAPLIIFRLDEERENDISSSVNLIELHLIKFSK